MCVCAYLCVYRCRGDDATHTHTHTHAHTGAEEMMDATLEVARLQELALELEEQVWEYAEDRMCSLTLIECVL